MKIAIHSDLHLEGNALPLDFGLNQDVDVVVLAGDIGVANLESNLLQIRGRYLDAKILFTPGNHEYYGFNFYSRNGQMQEICDELDIVFLDQKVWNYMGVDFIGVTGWSDLSSISAPSYEKSALIERNISDFYKIHMHGRKFTASDMMRLSHDNKKFIEHGLMTQRDQKKIVVTHFPPLLGVGNPIFGHEALTEYFHNDWSDLILRYRPDMWIYGHIHYNSPVKEYMNTRLERNQRGYHKEDSNLSYNPNYIVEI